MRTLLFRYGQRPFLLLLPCFLATNYGSAQDLPVKPPSGVQSSPFEAPPTTDLVFSVNSGPGLDTGCTYTSGGPLVFSIEIDRYFGDTANLISHGLLPERVRLQMPAYDVDFAQGERDRIFFNNHMVSEEFLTGTDGTWKLNTFEIPVSWLELPSDPGPNGVIVPAQNTIRIDIDVDIPGDNWCTAIDWAAITFDSAPLPVLLVHGILSDGGTWSGGGGPLHWDEELDFLGIPNSGANSTQGDPLNLGALDSIQQNAGEIAARIESLKTRWGVDRLNLVCHSKGGIDSREVAGFNDSIACLLQVGTPNLGAPLADLVQLGLLRICTNITVAQCLALQAVNIFAFPAGYQLTSAYMLGYNLINPINPKTSYRSLATRYVPAPGCFTTECGVEAVLASLTGPGDLIVPEYSVHGWWGSTSQGTLDGIGDRQLRHAGLPFLTPLGQTGSQRVFNNLRSSIETCGASISPPPMVGGLNESFTLTRGNAISTGQTEAHTFTVNPGTSAAAFVLQYAQGILDLTLTDPNGTNYTLATTPGTDGVFPVALSMFGGEWAAYRLENPLSGMWTLQVAGTNVVEPGGSSAYILSATLPSEGITLQARVREEIVHAGDGITLEATLDLGGAALGSSSVVATLISPDHVLSNVSLADDGLGPDLVAGDGVYSATHVTTSAGGVYRCLVVANGVLAGSNTDLEREALVVFTTSESGSSLTGVYSDSGFDSNGDGLFEELRIQVGADIQVAGTYRVFGILKDVMGNRYQVIDDADLPVGPHTFLLQYDGASIYANGVDGPYTLERIRLIEQNPTEAASVDGGSDVSTTSAYLFGQFQHDAIQVTGAGSDLGIDLDSDGDFDLLQVDVELNLAQSGNYAWSARLVDSLGSEIGFAGGQGFLSAGKSSIRTQFNGTTIGQSGANGPYYVRDVLINGAGGASSIPTVVYVTAPYLASDFNGYSGWSTYCNGNPNSTGFAAVLSQTGSNSLSSNNMTLHVERQPSNMFGIGVYGSSTAAFAFGSGTLCVSPYYPGLFRLHPVRLSDGTGNTTIPMDFTNLPPGGEIMAGTTWFFQYVYRDVWNNVTTFNLSSAIEITFVP